MQRKRTVVESSKTNIVSLNMNATFFYEKAVHFLDRYQYTKALKYFRRAMELEPENPVNHCNMAGVYSELGNYTESNKILKKVLDEVDPSMTECYFYMANNYMNLDLFESAEEALISYLEKDVEGNFLEECDEMIELLSIELQRDIPIKKLKSKEKFFDHDRARHLLEEGKCTEAIQLLEKILRKYPDFIAARNNLALAYYYIGDYEKTSKHIDEVLKEDPGNLHALCNLAIYYRQTQNESELSSLLKLLSKTYPYLPDQLYKLAMTLGLLGNHEMAYHHFLRLIKSGDEVLEPSLFHYAAVAAFNTHRYDKALRLWKQARSLNEDDIVPIFFINELDDILEDSNVKLSYHYFLPYEEHFQMLGKWKENVIYEWETNHLVRVSLKWALLNGSLTNKLQVLEIVSFIQNKEVENILRNFLLKPNERDKLKHIAVFLLRVMKADEPYQVSSDGKTMSSVDMLPLSKHLPNWDDKWHDIINETLNQMEDRFDVQQKFEMYTLWVNFVTEKYPNVPKIKKVNGWSAALEYLIAKIYSIEITYREVSEKYNVSVSTIRKNVEIIKKSVL
ncbi:tetratricopeptide repeat protein [Chengkuizengella axinellae]|uniref:Tetratricopeptide repeat protein n=1 Tax=Chengkuizengella axinellae TaxID=3064388 RepID=A0ABT9J2M4_9BACL|nr:tetratricopeptide repeat protein [Chengkuizengella sp. 2205SS18-9]MDP5275825.1 tetratricopeptide repeat protein [Chengkuizengella sp. 2205SS18-9]